MLIREEGLLRPIEIKSAQTFSPDFVKELEFFQTLGIKRLNPGLVLYNGAQQFTVRGVQVLNPFAVEDIWSRVTGH